MMTTPRIAVTMGDPAGIGPEICLRLLADDAAATRCVPLVFGDAEVLDRVAFACALPPPRQIIAFDDWLVETSDQNEAAVVDFSAIDANTIEPGRVDERTGRAAFAYIEAAISAAMSGRVDAVTTGPIHKEALHAAGVPYPGHTEIFTAQTGAQRTCMMLTSDEITCSLVTAHAGLCDVPKLLSVQRILDVIELSHEAMTRMRGRRPKLVVCGLNPHAGEHGLFGNREEEQLISPAITAARDKGIDVEGPLPPDTAFLRGRRRATDCFVCMYHDQGLIPLKMLAFDMAVNVTLGLPIVRTSVDHGTALDIAWQGKADATSLRQAVALAARMAAGRSQSVIAAS